MGFYLTLINRCFVDLNLWKPIKMIGLYCIGLGFKDLTKVLFVYVCFDLNLMVLELRFHL